MNWQAVRGLIFDVDGTLYRQFPVRVGMALRLLAHCLSAPSEGLETVRLIREYRRLQEVLRDAGDARDQPLLACRNVGVDPVRGVACVEAWMIERPLELISRAAFPGLGEFLSRALQRGLRLGVFSDYPAERKLEALGVLHYFTSVLSASDPGVRQFKPAPKGLLAVLQQLQLEPAQAVYVGDRVATDAACAQRAGVTCAIIACPRDRHGDGWVGVPDYATFARLLQFD